MYIILHVKIPKNDGGNKKELWILTRGFGSSFFPDTAWVIDCIRKYLRTSERKLDSHLQFGMSSGARACKVYKQKILREPSIMASSQAS